MEIPASDIDPLLVDLRQATQWRALGSLVPTLAHGLRAPLNGMVINVELLRELAKSPAAPDKRVERSVAALGRAVTQLREGLDGLMATLARQPEVTTEFDLGAVVEEIAALTRPQATVQRVVLVVDVPEQPVLVVGIRVHLKQALLNLVLNALEAMPVGGDLTLALRREGANAVVGIADRGAGIPVEIQAKLGELHFSTKAQGTGAGIYVARMTAEAHGGSLTIDSTVGRGTRVDLTLPAAGQGS